MADFIIVAVIVVLLMIGIQATKKHLKGQGNCCGGGSRLPRENKKLNHVVCRKIVKIDGMTCEHCQNMIERCINTIDGAAARVNLRKKVAVVSCEREIDDDEICRAVEKAGYRVVNIH